MWGNFFVDRAHVEISPALRRARSQHCPCDQLTSMLGFWTTHQEGDVIHFIYNPASCRRSRGSFAGTDSLESSDQARKHGRRRNGNVVGAEDHLYLRRKGCKSADRGSIGFQIGFGTV